MAQGQAVLASPRAVDGTTTASEKDLLDIEQFKRIVQFRDAVLSGNHPSIKLPAGLLAAPRSPSQSKPAAQTSTKLEAISHNQQAASANAGLLNTQSPAQASASATKRTFGSRTTEINPIFLEKSEELVRAEFQLQRQRLERALKEEVEQRRGFKQDKAEPLADQDLSEVLSKALRLVQATGDAPGADDEAQIANDEAASDSFTDNTFYSSKHPTPESNPASRVRNESEEARQKAIPEAQPDAVAQPAQVLPRDTSIHHPHEYQALPSAQGTTTYTTAVGNNTVATASASGPSQFQVPGLSNYPLGGAQFAQPYHATTSGGPSQREPPGVPDPAGNRSKQLRNAHQHLDDAYIDTHPPSPLVRAHDMIPVATQPASAPTNVVEERLAAAGDQDISVARGAPAQVAALRNEPVAVDSPESSPQSGKGSEKRKGKKKKRKADRQAPEEVTPYIKPEPRSPSPMGAPSYTRPSKRRRQSHRQANGADGSLLASVNNSPRGQPQPYHAQPMPLAYAGSSHPQRAASMAVVGDAGYQGAYAEGQRLPDGAYVRRQPSPVRYIQRPPSATYWARPVAQNMVDDGFREVRRAYQDPYEGGRISTRPEGDPYVGQPMPPPTRIIVDSFGREYIEPSHLAQRQSVAPGPSYGHEVVYERPPPRAVSRHPGSGPYDDNRNVVYTRAASAYPGHRRVVTQPEYVSQDFRDPHPREYSVRPVAPPAEYVPTMPPPERHPGVEGAAEYDTRATSVRPMESVRYEMPRDYGRMQRVRPEPLAPEYTGSVHPTGRREVAQPYVMDYGPRPVEQPVYQRGYSVRPVERYYEQPPLQGREEIAFIEQPRGATQEVV